MRYAKRFYKKGKDTIIIRLPRVFTYERVGLLSILNVFGFEVYERMGCLRQVHILRWSFVFGGAK
jgi:hypothetical protein